MMKRLTVHIISDSDIIRAGLASTVASLNIPAVAVNTNTNILEHAQEGEQHLIMADAASMPPEQVADLRSQLPAGTGIIGVICGSLPGRYMSAFDETLSVYCDASAMKAMINKIIAGFGDGRDTTDKLTPREREIIVGVVKGLSNKEIAEHLSVSVNTVMTHRRNIASKLQIHSPAGLTIYAIVSKLVSIDEIKQGKI